MTGMVMMMVLQVAGFYDALVSGKRAAPEGADYYLPAQRAQR